MGNGFLRIVMKKGDRFARTVMKTGDWYSRTVMKMWNKQMRKILNIVMICLLLYSCRGEEVIYPALYEQVPVTNSDYVGMFLLNEGNMGSNKAQIDYLDFATGTYTRNFYGAQNPKALKELGDVGNDIQIYGQKIYAIINCSHKVEVMNLDGKRIGQIEIANCRYLAFHEDYAYVSSYLGWVHKVDTTSLMSVDSIKLGLEPDGMAISGDKLYVCNSGGYHTDTYDNTLSVVNLKTFTEEKRIEVGTNPTKVSVDKTGQIWVLMAEGLVCLQEEKIIDKIEGEYNDICVSDDYVYALDRKGAICMIGIDEHKVAYSNEIEIETPYSIKVDETSGNIFVTDAKNYVSSGTLICYTADGRMLWKTLTGDIPGHMCFTKHSPRANEADFTEVKDEHIHVVEYTPAPGQFIHIIPAYSEGDSPEIMNKKAEELLNEGKIISLGGWGGYVIMKLDSAIVNKAGANDFQILGNAYYQTGYTNFGSSEPGIVMVSSDENGNGIADDTWYELAGSEYSKPETNHQYVRTYRKSDTYQKTAFHDQDYYPQWLGDSLVFKGSLLAHTPVTNNNQQVQPILAYGYADNKPNSDNEGCSFDIDWAVNSNGEKVSLDRIDFVKVYTADDYFDEVGGEISTEIAGLKRL